jgi:hypothetical protein
MFSINKDVALNPRCPLRTNQMSNDVRLENTNKCKNIVEHGWSGVTGPQECVG